MVPHNLALLLSCVSIDRDGFRNRGVIGWSRFYSCVGVVSVPKTSTTSAVGARFSAVESKKLLDINHFFHRLAHKFYFATTLY